MGDASGASPRPASGRFGAILFLAFVAAAMVVPTSLATPAPSHLTAPGTPAPGSTVHVPTNSVATARSLAAPPGPPSSFWGANTTFTDLPAGVQVCTRSNTGGTHSSNCYPQSQNPTILSLSNGDIGVGYSVYTNQSATACGGSAANVLSQIGFAVSHDGGHHFASFAEFGNDTCSYLQATEPSFALSSTGEIVSAFVEENKSTAKNPVFPPSYTSRVIGALGFSTSSTNGATWTPVVTLNGSGNITRPVVAAFGSTIYVVYENTSNSSLTYPGGLGSGNFHALALHLLTSFDGGVHWIGPTTLPGENATMGYWSVSPSIAVNATGTVAVAYATNRSCVYGCSTPGGARYADDLVVVTSRTNGTTWNGPHRVRAGVGESHCWGGFNGPSCLGSPFEWTPQTYLSFSQNGTGLYLAWAGTFPVAGPAQAASTYLRSGVFVGSSTSAATRWKTATIQANTNGYTLNEFYLPAVAEAPNGTIFLTYTEMNTTSCVECPGLNGAFSQWVVTSTDGISWSSSHLVGVDSPATPSTVAVSWSGWGSSVAFTSSGVPLLGYVFPRPYHQTTQSSGSNSWYNYTYGTNLTISYPYTGPLISLNVTENGLAPGAAWEFFIDGVPYNQTVRWVVVSGLPENTSLLVDTQRILPGFWTQITFRESVPSESAFARSSTVYFNFTEFFGFQLIYATNVAPLLDVAFYYNGTYYYDDENRYCYTFGCYGNHNWYPGFPWYFPAGAVLHLAPDATPPVGYWNGSGRGSYTGLGSQANVTMDAPINETLWSIAAGVYNETFNSAGLPSTSQYSFELGAHSYSAPATGPDNVTGLLTGAYALRDVQANSSSPGWEYFGVSSVGSTVVIPAEPIVNLSFALVDVAAAPGPVSFHALGFTNGTVWSIELNGTSYSSWTPWINLTTHPGTYPWKVGTAVVAANDSVGYTPTAVGPNVTVTSGGSVNVGFTPAYRVEVVAGIGGSTTSPGVHWLPDGSSATYNATAGGGYSFVGWSGTGVGSYNGTDRSANLTAGGPIVETASFSALPTDRFNVTFTGLDLAPGTWWTVFLNGVGYSSNSMNLTVSGLYPCSAGAAGSYSLNVPYAYPNDSSLSRYVPGHYPARFCTNGNPAPTLVAFTPQYAVSVEATAGGSATVTVGSNQSSTSLWASPTDFVQVQATPSPGGGFQFVNWTGTGSGSYTGPSSVATVSPSGTISELAMFVPVPPRLTPHYFVHFQLTSALAPGTVWNVTFDGVGYSSDSTFLNLSGFAPTSYALSVSTAYSPDNLTRYVPNSAPDSVPVKMNTTVPIGFARAFWVDVSGTTGGTVSGGDAWVGASASVSINATPDPGFVFAGWNGSGPGNYTGGNQGALFAVSGPVVERAEFVPAPPVAASTSSVWSNPAISVGLLVAGVVAGGAIGFVVSRKRPNPTIPHDAPAPSPETSGAGSVEPAGPEEGG